MPSGPGEESLGRAYLAAQVRDMLPTVAAMSELEAKRLLGKLSDLPALDLSPVLRLPDVSSDSPRTRGPRQPRGPRRGEERGAGLATGPAPG